MVGAQDLQYEFIIIAGQGLIIWLLVKILFAQKKAFVKRNMFIGKIEFFLHHLLQGKVCPAMLRLALKDGVKWVITKFIEEHNHGLLSPSKVPWRGSTKILSMR